MGEAAVEVRGVPSDVADELLVLYFENRRRSGGGPVQTWRRRGGRATLAFEHPEDARRVLSRTDHALQGVRLAVQPAAPRDYGKVVLQGVKPQSSLELVELYVEHMLDCERGDFSLCRSPAGDQVLVQLQQLLSHAEFLILAERVQRRTLDGASLMLDWVEQTGSLLVQSRGSNQLQQEVLELYFESKRSSGGCLEAVKLLPGGTMAIISFRDLAVAQRVLKRPHQLQDDDLDVSPHYDFLEPQEGTEGGPGAGEAGEMVFLLPEGAPRQLLQAQLVLQALGSSAPECTLRLDTAALRIAGGDPAARQRLQEHVGAALRAVAEERLPSSTWVLAFLRREDVQEGLAERLAEQGVGACYLPTAEEVLAVALEPSGARRAASLLGTFLRSFTLPLSERQRLALATPRWAQAQAGVRCCLARLAEGGEHLEALTLLGLEEESVAELTGRLRDCLPEEEEALVATEPGRLRYLQRHHQDLLAGMAEVTLLPLEGTEVTGFRLIGESWACQAAAELLQSLLSAICKQTVTLQLPGVSRFLTEERGQALVQGLEKRFRCVLSLEHVRWHPQEAQHELEASWEPIALDCRRDPLPGPQPCPEAAASAGCQQGGPNVAEPVRLPSPAETAKGLLAALQTPRAASSEPAKEPRPREQGRSPAPGLEVAARPACVEQASWRGLRALKGGALPFLEPLPGQAVGEEEEEEEEQWLLAIQQSMDSVRQEEEDLQRATECSLRSWEQEQAPRPEAALQSVLSDSLQVATSAHLEVYAGTEEELETVSQELERALRTQLQDETVQHQALGSLPARCLDYLTHLEKKHAVRISLDGSVATVLGFVDYPMAATRDLALLLARLLQAEAAGGCGAARWVRWEPTALGVPTPYSAQASALLERAWHSGHRRMDVFFDGQPFRIDFQHMEEYDVGRARALPIGRTEPPLLLAPPGSARLSPLAEGEGSLVPLAESSEEFQRSVCGFYGTLEDLQGKIRIVKVEKVMHPLLYQQYQLKKAAMEKACGHQAVERVLFHGTTELASREICRYGFNRSFCGKNNATHHGHGVYFAVKAFLSAQDQFSPCSSSGNKYIFIARTLTGDHTLGSRSLRAPPLREGDAAGRRYDSTVDHLGRPSIFVIFNDTQAYPEFLVTCRWSEAR